MGSKEKLRQYLVNHKDDEWFSKYYGAYFFPIFVQSVFALKCAAAQSEFAMRHGLLFQEWTGSREFNWLWKVSEMRESRTKIFEALEKDYNFGKKFYDNYVTQFNIFDIAARQEEMFDYVSAGNQTLVECMLYLIEAASRQGHGYVVDCFLTAGEEDWFAKQIQKYSKEKLSETDIETLRLPTQRTFVSNAHLKNLEIACAKKQAKNIDDALKELQRKYYWIENSYLRAVPKMQKDFLEEVRLVEEPCREFEIESVRLEINKTKRFELLDRIKASGLLRAFVQMTDDFTFIQDMRKQVVLRLNHFLLHYIEKIAESLHYDRNLAFLLRHDELKEFIKDPQSFTPMLEERSRGFLAVYEGQDYVIFSRKELEDVDLTNFYPDLSDTKEVQGTPASPGNVTGIVRVILGADQFKNFNRGDVLVTNQTTPDFVPLMKKSCAVIAEQGGVTSHAAIVSRELGIPAIVGVDKAMQIFKDGDRVEIDAERGVVRKI